MISSDLQLTLFEAFQQAQLHRHEYLTVEHLLYAMLENELGQRIITSCGGIIEPLRENLEYFFDNHLEKLPDEEKKDPIETIAFQRVLQNAIFHVNAADKKEADAGDILAAILDESDSHACYYLEQQGILRLDVLRFISHELDGPDPDSYDDDEDDIDALFNEEEMDDFDDEVDGGGTKSGAKLLEKYCTDLVTKAEAGGIDPLIGRDAEMKRMTQVLCRRQKNNPIFVGEPGVGKTAMAGGLALKLAADDVPERLSGYALYSLDLGSMIAGTKFRGQFEERLKGVISALLEMQRVILFIDEIHTLVGAGSVNGGTLDAANLLKPFFATGEIRCIGTTTHEEYRQAFEKDRALARRFQQIQLEEPSVDETVKILQGLQPRLEEHHDLKFTSAAVRTAAELAAKHINDRYLPDKAIDVLDEAAAAQHLLPPSRRRKRILPRDVEQVVSEIARVPVKSSDLTPSDRLRNLETGLYSVVFGQDEAVSTLCKALKRSHAGLNDPEKPLGSFLFTGPTGVGKTELSRQLAAWLGIGFLRFDMSEYMEKHSVARLIGAPPGYVGYEKGGLLTEKIRQQPHTVLLLDEIEKAHPDIFNVLLQIMDHASLTDNNGRRADFRNVILIMTSNAGAREMSANAIGFGDPQHDSASRGKKALENRFSPEFRNRLDEIIYFKNLGRSSMLQVVDKFLRKLHISLESAKVDMSVSEAARQWLAQHGYDPSFGARPLGRLIQRKIKDPLSEEILFGHLAGGGKVNVEHDPAKDSLSFTFPGEA